MGEKQPRMMIDEVSPREDTLPIENYNMVSVSFSWAQNSALDLFVSTMSPMWVAKPSHDMSYSVEKIIRRSTSIQKSYDLAFQN